eukprot:TRINITY_DN539_c0_g1_i4.p2 TRINITY_DN539_c0_g1~~TRINITY_DN539_c0_g1_i4.p2  ORF type:complete len:162 (+),score=31.62 TRINITY_DN539_c0_g1_i4:58-543(+)
MKTTLAILITLLSLSAVYTHPTHYPIDKVPLDELKEMPKIFSWHVHCLYYGIRNASVTAALEYLEEVKSVFGLDTHCNNLFHNPGRCYFNPDPGPAGPFPTAQWAVYFLPEDYAEFVAWFQQNRGDWDIFVHPNSGYELEDHRDWGLWGGREWPLDTSIFQ